MSRLWQSMAIGKAAVPFEPDKDIPSLDGKVILITGGNNGLGKQAVCEYVKHNPKQIWLAARMRRRCSGGSG
ncbi:mdj1 protein precursor [Metarhizium acridum]|nr:mdj1 protein precursor [Metarhizium acridum]